MARKRKERPDGCLIYGASFKSLLLLPDENAGRAIKAAARYFLYGEASEGLDLSTQIVFTLLQSDADNSMSQFAETCERNRKIAEDRERKRGTPAVTNGDQSLPVVTNRIELNQTESNLTELKKNKADKPQRKQFVPPSLEEISGYVKERGSGIDPRQFYDFYDSAGWIDTNGHKVRSWKQKLISWEARESNGRNSPDHRADRGKGTGGDQKGSKYNIEYAVDGTKGEMDK